MPRCVQEVPDRGGNGGACSLAEVIDGDSIRCADGREVRLLSIDAPELVQRPWGWRARDALLELAPVGTTLSVEYDLERRDDFGRDLAYLYVEDGTMLNRRMVASGHAVAFVIPPNRRHAAEIRQAEEDARAASAGLWAEGAFACLPADFRNGACP